MKFKMHFFLAAMALLFGSFATATAYELGDVDIHGFVSQGYLETDKYNYMMSDTDGGTFDLGEVGISLTSQASDSIRVGAQFLSRRLGEDGNSKVGIAWAFGDYQHNRYVGLRAGKIRMPMGLYNQTRDIDAVRTGVFLPQSVYTDTIYTFTSAIYGASVYGTIPLTESIGELEYEVFWGRGENDDESYIVKRSGWIAQNSLGGALVDAGMDYHEVYGGAARWNTPLEGLRLGYSVAYIKVDLNYGLYEGLDPSFHNITSFDLYAEEAPISVLSAEYVWNDLTLATEWFHRREKVTRLARNPSPIISGDVSRSNDVTDMEGYYFSAAYRVNDWLELGGYYEEFYPDADDKNGDRYSSSDFMAWRKSWVFTGRFDINDFWIVKLEYHLNDGIAEVSTYTNREEYPTGNYPDKKWNMLAIKTTFSF